MKDQSRTNQELQAEISLLKQKIQELEQADSAHRRVRAKWKGACAKRKQAEAILRESEERYQSLFENSFMGISQVLPDGRLAAANRAYAQMYGYANAEEMMAKVANVRQLYAHQEDRKDVRRTISEKGFMEPRELTVVHSNGTHLTVLVGAREIRDHKGNLRYYQAEHLEITDRKRAENELLTSRAQMRALAERLLAVREEERTLVARKIHDELGGALTGLKIDISLLRKAVVKIEDENVRASLLAHMDSMAEFVDVSVETVRGIAMELRPCILDDLGLVAALEWQRKDFEKRTGIRCELFVSEEDISLDADLDTALFRIFQEAMTNVASHSAATEVHIHLRVDADSCTLEVEDNGSGIEKEKAGSSTSLGILGMSERAQIFGGRITVMGTPGIGTTVIVEIPLAGKRKMDRERGGTAG